MRISGSIIDGLLGVYATQGIGLWMRTLDARVAYQDPDLDPAFSRAPRRIYVFWHENILLPLFLRGGCEIVTLMSQHRDADVLVRIAGMLGFDCVRGSSYRGGTRALKKLVRVAEQSHVAITPDGPRGPRRQMTAGPIFLASKLGMPIVPIGVGYDRPWRMDSWDRFAVPRPFSRARVVLGESIVVPPELSRQELEASRLSVQRHLDDATAEAEAWAAATARKQGEFATRPTASRKYSNPACAARLRLAG